MINLSISKIDKTLYVPYGSAAGKHPEIQGGVSSGFTLLEVMVALSILAIVLVAVFRLQSQSIAMHSAARFHSLAPLLAQSKMAEIVSSKIEDLSISDSGDFGENFAGYTWQFTINDIESEILEDYAEKFKRIDLVITLNDGEYQYGFRSYKLFEE